MNKQLNLIFVLFLVISTGMTISYQFQEEDSPDTITVMSYNIHQFFVEDPDNPFDKTGDYIFDDLLEVIKNEEPNIIGLQEAEGARFSSGHVQGIAWLAEQLDMYYYYGAPTSEQIYGNSILSEWPIIEATYDIYPRPEGIERALVQIVIQSPFGNLNVFNTHFAIGRFQLAQEQAAKFLIDKVGDSKAIITGDFNTAFGDDIYNILASEFTYGSVEAGFGANDSETFTAPASDPRRKIDFIWLTQNDWQVIPNSYRTIGSVDTSDHLGIVVELLPL